MHLDRLIVPNNLFDLKLRFVIVTEPDTMKYSADLILFHCVFQLKLLFVSIMFLPLQITLLFFSNITWSRQVTEVLPQLEILDGVCFIITLLILNNYLKAICIANKFHLNVAC